VFAPDGQRAYVSGHGTDTVYVIDVARRAVVREVAVGKAPVDLAISSDGRWLYAANSRSDAVSVIDTAALKVAATVAAGFEPRGLCLSASGDRLYVADHISNDVSVIDTAARKEIARVPVGRMPTFLALTPDAKRLLVSNRLSAMPATDPKTTAFVSVIDTATLKVVAEKKSAEPMHVVQQTAVSPDGRYAYTVHLRPNFNITPAQLGQGWIETNALTIIPLERDEPPMTVLLDNLTSGAGNPYGVAVSKDGTTLYVTHTGIQQVSVINLPKLHAMIEKRPAETRPQLAGTLGFLWGAKGVIRRVDCGGLGPKGVAVSPADGSVWIANYFSDAAAVLDAKTGAVVATIPLGARREMTEERRGEFLFSSALHCFQNWLSCTSCHPDTRADALNWDLMNDGLTNPKNTRSLVGSPQTPPMMALGVRADVQTAVEKGFLFIQFHDVSKKDKDAVVAYLRAVPFIPSPFHRTRDGRLDEQAQRGQKVFEKAGCGMCHPPPLYTTLRSYDVGTAGDRDVKMVVEDLEEDAGKVHLPAKAPTAEPKTQATTAFDTPALLELYRTAPYLHDGRAATLRDVLTKFNAGDRHGRTSDLTPQEIDDLVAFLLSL
jgi:YVTN family beta-propeller protein